MTQVANSIEFTINSYSWDPATDNAQTVGTREAVEHRFVIPRSELERVAAADISADEKSVLEACTDLHSRIINAALHVAARNDFESESYTITSNDIEEFGGTYGRSGAE
jgi:hypothetical protein